ncbi:5313_t:CDS:1, partial [Funneliformis caledonium]
GVAFTVGTFYAHLLGCSRNPYVRFHGSVNILFTLRSDYK